MKSSLRQTFMVARRKDQRTSHGSRKPSEKLIMVVQVKDKELTGGADETACMRGQSDKYYGRGEEVLSAATH